MKKKLFLTIAVTLGLTAATMAQNVPAYVSTNGLVGWWPFNGNANDESGNGNNATVNGATLTSDRYGNANASYSFNGSSNYLEGSASTFPTGNRSIAIWFYTTNINVGSAGMQTFGYGGGVCEESWLMQMDNTTPAASFFTDNTFEVSIGCNTWITALPFGVNGTPSNPNNNWHHWVITNGPSGVEYYIDGNYAGGATAVVGGTQVTGKKYFIGSCPDLTGVQAYQDAYLSHWNGKLDDVGIWNRVLTPQEISDLFNGNTSGITDLSYSNKISVYPNPADNTINLNVGKEFIGQDASIFDLYGRSVKTIRISEENSLLDISNLTSGIFVIKLKNNPSSIIQFIKN